MVTPDAEGAAADAERDARPWRTHVAVSSERGAVVRARMHLRRLPWERDIAEALRDLATSAALTQFEGHNSAPLLPAAGSTPAVYSTQNVDSAIERDRATAHPRLTRPWLRHRYRASMVRAIEREASARAEAVICVSDDDAAAFEPLARRVVIAPNGVDDEFFAVPPALPDNEDVLFFGQFTYAPNARGITRFLSEGWPALARARPRARLLVAGEGAEQHLGEAPAERVVVLGLVPSVADSLAAARAVVVPIWLGGGTRLKVLEALASRRPLVGTSLGVAGIGFRDGAHGLVRDEPSEIARALADLLADDGRSRALAAAGAELSARFAWSRALAPAETLYEELLAAQRLAATPHHHG